MVSILEFNFLILSAIIFFDEYLSFISFLILNESTSNNKSPLFKNAPLLISLPTLMILPLSLYLILITLALITSPYVVILIVFYNV